MNKFNNIKKIIAIGSATCLGWAGGFYYSKKTIFTNYPLFPTLNTVSAATQQGSLMQVQSYDIVPEPAPNAPRIAQIMRFGFPSLSNIRSFDDYILSYDTRNRVPNWVFEHLTSESIVKNISVDRAKSEFQEDGSFHHFFRSQNTDYKGSGFDRGHMAAAGNHRKCQKHCDETFLLSNMAPQVGKGFNRDKWNELEMYSRRLTKNFKNVYICTGPLYLPRLENDGKLYIKYQVLGKNHVAVPTHFFKVVVCEHSSGSLEIESFVLPNEAISEEVPIQTFHVDPEVVERASGLLFFDKINKNKFSKVNGKTT